jgi:hypothetical protein
MDVRPLIAVLFSEPERCFLSARLEEIGGAYVRS